MKYPIEVEQPFFANPIYVPTLYYSTPPIHTHIYIYKVSESLLGKLQSASKEKLLNSPGRTSDFKGDGIETILALGEDL